MDCLPLTHGYQVHRNRKTQSCGRANGRELRYVVCLAQNHLRAINGVKTNGFYTARRLGQKTLLPHYGAFSPKPKGQTDIARWKGTCDIRSATRATRGRTSFPEYKKGVAKSSQSKAIGIRTTSRSNHGGCAGRRCNQSSGAFIFLGEARRRKHIVPT